MVTIDILIVSGLIFVIVVLSVFLFAAMKAKQVPYHRIKILPHGFKVEKSYNTKDWDDATSEVFRTRDEANEYINNQEQ